MKKAIASQDKFNSIELFAREVAKIGRTRLSQLLNGAYISESLFIAIFLASGVEDWERYAITVDGQRLVPEEPEAAGIVTPFKVPFMRNRFFTGRENLLNEIHQQLTTETAVAITQVQAINGLGGIGKTQTAVEYANIYFYDQSVYKYVFWVTADTVQTLSTNFAAIAEQLALPCATLTNKVKVAAVKAWLATNDDWLLIFDNADEPELLVPFMPNNPNGKVLLTSRAAFFDMLGIAEAQLIQEFSESESVSFLINRTAFERNQENELGAKQIHQELEGLPLALEQAAAFILRKKLSFTSYINLYRKRGVDFLEKISPQAGNYPTSVCKTWLINFEAVEQENPISAELLRLNAFFGSDLINYNFLSSCGTILGEPLLTTQTTADLDEALLIIGEVLEPLYQYSLILWQHEIMSYRIHRLVQGVTRETISVSEQVKYVDKAAQVIGQAPIQFGYENLKINLMSVPHWEKVLEHSVNFDVKTKNVGLLAGIAGLFFSEQQEFISANSLIAFSSEIYEQSEPEKISEEDTLLSISNYAALGSNYFQQKCFDKAIPCFCKVLDLCCSISDSQQAIEFKFIVINNFLRLSLCQIEMMEFTDEPVVDYSAEERDAVMQLFTKSQSELSSIIENRADEIIYEADYHETLLLSGVLALKGGRLDEAEETLRTAVQIFDSVYGKHPTTAMAISNYASVFSSTGLYDRAEQLFRTGLEYHQESLGFDNFATANYLQNLCSACGMQEKYDEALEYIHRALEIYCKKLGEDSEIVAATKSAIGIILTIKGQYEEAWQYLENSLVTRGELHDELTPSMISSLENAAVVARQLEQYDQSEQIYKLAIEKRIELFGEDDFHLLVPYQNLAALYQQLGRYEDAQKAMENAVGIVRTNDFYELTTLATVLGHLGNVYLHQKKIDQARSCFDEIIEIAKTNCDENDPWLAKMIKATEDKLSRPFSLSTSKPELLKLEFPKRFDVLMNF